MSNLSNTLNNTAEFSVAVSNLSNPLSNTAELSVAEKRASIVEMLRVNKCIITFVKKDGTDRVMQCTLKEGVVVPYEKKTERTREVKEDLLPVWDLEANAWRSINVSTVKSLEFIL